MKKVEYTWIHPIYKFALFSAKKRYMGSYPSFKSAKERADKIVGTYVVPDPNTNGVWYLCNCGFVEFIIKEV